MPDTGYMGAGPQAAPRPRAWEGAGDVPALRLEHISVRFALRRLQRSAGEREVVALSDVNLSVPRGGTIGIVGESGSGKTTLGLVAVQELRPTSGRIYLGDEAVTRGVRPGRIQMVFQDPVSSLDPRMRVEDILREPLEAMGSRETPSEMRARMVSLMEHVGLREEHLSRRRSQFSGGQCQRIAIARAMITRPEVVILDEPTSSLDVIVQARVLALLEDFQDEYGTAYMFISHNLAVVEAISDTVMVLYRGHVVEEGPTEAILRDPLHPYTRALADAVLDTDAWRDRDRFATQPSSIDTVGVEAAVGVRGAARRGCIYAARCPLRVDVCTETEPRPTRTPDGRLVACHVTAPAREAEALPVGGG